MTSKNCDQPHSAINYHSVATFREWYEEVVRIDNAGQAVFIAHVMEFIPTNIATQRIRCAGTIISENHLLTTATCVSLPANSQAVIGVQATWAGQGLNTGKITFQVFVPAKVMVKFIDF